jgi:hypothetical protein
MLMQALASEDTAMDTAEASTSGSDPAAGLPPKHSNTPEVEMYCFMLLLMYLMDAKKPQQVNSVNWERMFGHTAARCAA